MVVLLDLEEGGFDSLESAAASGEIIGVGRIAEIPRRPAAQSTQLLVEDEALARPNPNINSFSAALACYPIVIQLATSIDLNTLHSLAQTCRQFRSNLLQFRDQLVAHTLRCTHDRPPSSSSDERDETFGYYTNLWGPDIAVRRTARGKIGPCARDMVDDCRRCGTTVCRNCTTKPPSASTLPNRMRRLCRTCLKTPLSNLMEHATSATEAESFTKEAFARGPCSCPDIVYICQHCGQSLACADITYKRIWTWRTRYSTYLGGLGTGIGEGNEGVKCGRGARCFGAEETELEIDCGGAVDRLLRLSAHNAIVLDIPEVNKPGYLSQEIEGIGGVVKKKVKKRVRIGQTVKEFEDERDGAPYLGREVGGQRRAWCGWCDRVILSSAEKEALEAAA